MEIEGYDNYLIYEDCSVWSKKSKKFLKPSLTYGGYLQVGLCKNGKSSSKRLHRLFAKYYIPNPNNYPCVDHINRIRNDNRIENLRWATYETNAHNSKNRTDNTSGHRFILRDNKYWIVRRTIDKKLICNKLFKTKIDAICYKFIFNLKLKSKVV